VTLSVSLYVIMETQKGNVALGLVLLIVAMIFIFVGLPYLVRMLKSNQPLSYRSPSAYVTETAPSLAVQNDWRSQSHYNDSAYKGRVIIVGIGQIGRQSINLSAMPNPNGLVNINGWKITTSRFNDFVIGSGLQLVGFGVAGDIILTAGLPSGDFPKGDNQVKIWAGQSPIAANFRVNKCLGLISGINFDIIPLAGAANYNSCVQARQNDTDFYKEWRVYALSPQLFDPLHDIIQLKDPSGFIVDQYQY